MRARWSGWAAAAAVACAAPGCALADVTIPAGEDVLVVEAVLRTDRDPQTLLLHRTLVTGRVDGEADARVTVRGARSGVVTFLQGPPDACYRQAFAGPDLPVFAACYVASAPEGWVRPGETYDLTIETRRGERVRGRTRVPDDFALTTLPFDRREPGGDARCVLLPGTTLNLVWTRSPGAWSYLSRIEISGLRNALPAHFQPVPDPLELLGLAVSDADTTLVLPTEFGIFERFELNQDLLRALQNGFPAGTLVDLTVAAADRNFVNGVRGGTFNPSGPVRISSVVGDGVGVFGSLVPLSLRIEVRAPDPGKRVCGRVE